MATKNPFDIFEDVEYDDPSQLVAAVSIDKLKKTPAPAVAAQQAKPAAKLPSKPTPPAQAEVREARNESGRGRGRGGGRGYGQGRGGGRGYDQDSGNNEGRYGGSERFSGDFRPREEGDVERQTERRGGGGGPRGSFRGGRRGGFNNGEVAEGERPRRTYERHSGTGRGNELKREGFGRGNWGSHTDDVAPAVDEAVTENEKSVAPEKPVGEEEPAADATKETAETEEKEPEDNEMTLEEYQKVLEEKRKALLGERTEERKVEVDKDLKAMQQLSSKKDNHDDIFIKLGSEKDRRKDVEKEERAKKSVSINEFLKPAEGEKHFSRGGRGGRGGRGRGGRGGDGEFGGGGGGFRGSYAVSAPKIEDPSHFPSLGGK